VADIWTQKNTTRKDYQTSGTKNQLGVTKICCDTRKYVETSIAQENFIFVTQVGKKQVLIDFREE
jgi:hypothetical protein